MLNFALEASFFEAAAFFLAVLVVKVTFFYFPQPPKSLSGCH